MFLDQKEYYQQKIKDVSLSNTELIECEFEECRFSHCQFLNTKIKNCRFINCQFSHCTFSAIDPTESRFIEVSFDHSKVLSFDWSLTGEIRGLYLDDCQLDYSNFRMLSLPKLKLINSSAKKVGFEEVDLSESDFSNTDFEEATFFKANLYKANFKGAKNYVIDPKTNKLKKTKFSYPEVMSLLTALDIEIEE